MDGESKRGGGGAGEPSAGMGEEEEKLSRRFSTANSVASTGAADDDEEEDGEEDEKGEIVLGPQVALKEQLELDKDDESLRRWKEQLLGSIDLSAVGGASPYIGSLLPLTKAPIFHA